MPIKSIGGDMTYQEDYHLFLMNNLHATTRHCTDKASQLLILSDFELEEKDKEISQLKYENAVFRELLTSHRLLRKKEEIEEIWVECNWEVLQVE